MNKIQIFNSERFGSVRTIVEDDTVLFCGADVAKALGYSNPWDAIQRHCRTEGIVKREGVTSTTNQYGVTTSQTNMMTFITEGNLYRLVAHSKLPAAEQFERWVFDEILPSIRKHGAYLTPDALEVALTDPDFAIGLLQSLKDERTKRMAAETKCVELQGEIEHKENVIIGLVEGIDLATKRQRINQIVRHGVKGGEHIAQRWRLLYAEFERKYHVDLKRRQESPTYADIKPKFKNTMDFIDRGLNMTAETFELACKLFENDVDVLKSEWECAVA